MTSECDDGAARPIILSAVDKFRGTATSRELGRIIESSISSQDLLGDIQSMSDGGEGFLDVFDGEVVAVEAPGPLLTPVIARVKIVRSTSGTLGVVEVSDVVGRDLLPAPSDREALAASSDGVGYLILAAANHGVDEVLVGCGGTATSDGGLGCYRVLVAAGGLPVPVTAATDVTASFSGARRYALQKGVSPNDLVVVDERLRKVRAQYLEERSVDVESVERSGAAGGIPGALAALGARLTSGFDAVTRSVDLATRVTRSSMVVTGEGRFDGGSLEGKVTVGMAELVHDRLPLLVVCGSLDQAAARTFRQRFTTAMLVSLEERFGRERAFGDVLACVDSVVRDELQRHFSSCST
ncbi:MAG: glycerate kinase [Acidimicrobiales bacterium]